MIELDYCECGCHGSSTPKVGSKQLWLYTNLDPKQNWRCTNASIYDSHGGYGKRIKTFSSRDPNVDNAQEAIKYMTKVIHEETQQEIVRLTKLLLELRIES